jgi:hypothetical protein
MSEELTPKPTVDVDGKLFSWPENPILVSLEKSYVSDMMRSREYEVINRLITKICSQEILDLEEITCCGLNPRKALEALKIFFSSCPNIIQNTEDSFSTTSSHIYDYYLKKNGELHRKRKEESRKRRMTACGHGGGFVDHLYLREETN